MASEAPPTRVRGREWRGARDDNANDGCRERTANRPAIGPFVSHQPTKWSLL